MYVSAQRTTDVEATVRVDMDDEAATLLAEALNGILDDNVPGPLSIPERELCTSLLDLLKQTLNLT